MCDLFIDVCKCFVQSFFSSVWNPLLLLFVYLFTVVWPFDRVEVIYVNMFWGFLESVFPEHGREDCLIFPPGRSVSWDKSKGQCVVSCCCCCWWCLLSRLSWHLQEFHVLIPVWSSNTHIWFNVSIILTVTKLVSFFFYFWRCRYRLSIQQYWTSPSFIFRRKTK